MRNGLADLGQAGPSYGKSGVTLCDSIIIRECSFLKKWKGMLSLNSERRRSDREHDSCFAYLQANGRDSYGYPQIGIAIPKLVSYTFYADFDKDNYYGSNSRFG